MIRLGAILVAGMAMFAMSAHAADSSLSPQANAAFLKENAKKPGVITTADGLQYKIIHNGFGRRPKAEDTVTVNYKGALINGKVFDQTEPGLPATFQVNQLIPGWTEALQLMREGDQWHIVIPSDLAYGARGAGGAIPPNQTLVFDLTLLKMEPAPPPKHDEQK